MRESFNWPSKDVKLFEISPHSELTHDGFSLRSKYKHWQSELNGGAGEPRIIDLTAQADKSVRKGMRDPKKVWALVLHQMACCFKVKDPLTRFLKMAPHFAILPDGRILQLHPILAMTWASNGFNPGSVAVEFAGNFPDTRGKWWIDREEAARLKLTPAQVKLNQNQVTSEQIEAGRYLVQHLIKTMGLKVIVAHRQSSKDRENDPGPDIWYNVGQWAVDNLGLSDGGPGFKVGGGYPIPDLWRNWGRVKPQRELAAYESELESGSAPAEIPIVVQYALLAKNEDLAIKLAIMFGNRNENSLTDMVFYSRHPEVSGRRIAPHETQLIREWAFIQSQLVRPALGAGKTSTSQGGSVLEKNCQHVGCTEGGTPAQRIAALIPLLNRYRGDIPLEFLVGWLMVESGGCNSVVTHLCERGYFQIHPEESADHNFDHRRISTDREYSIMKGIELIKAHAANTARLGFTPGTDLFWHMVKLRHWLPKGVQQTLSLMKTQNVQPTTWEEFKQFMMTNRAQLLRMIGTSEGTGWDPASGINNVESMYNYGRDTMRVISGG
jgi:N-acetylmuramoyl-L-alanine amidase